MPTFPIFYECEIPDVHRNIFIVNTHSLFVHLIDTVISNNFSGVKIDFRFRKKSEVGTYDLTDGYDFLLLFIIVWKLRNYPTRNTLSLGTSDYFAKCPKCSQKYY